MKLASIISIVIILAWVSMSAAEIWFDIMSVEMYWKITLTMLLVGGGVILASLVAREYLGEKKMKKDKFID